MKIRLEQGAFNEVVSWVLRAVGTRSTLPALGGIAFHAEGEQVTLSGTDLDISSTASVECAVDTPGTVLIMGRLLGEIAKNLPEGAVTVEADEKQVTISSGTASFKLRTLPIEDFPELPQPEGKAGEVALSDFAAAVNQVARAASNDEARPVLTGVLVDPTAEKATLVATDSYRLAVRELAWTGPADAVAKVVPARALTEASKIADEGSTAINFGEASVSFKVEGRTLASRLIEGDFPNWKGLIPDDLPNKFTVDKEVLTDAVRRVGLLAQSGVPVKVKLTSTGADLSAGSQDIGDATEHIDGKYEGEELEVAFNPTFLLDGIAAIASDEVSLMVRDGLKPAVLRAPEDDGFLYLIMPVRI